MKRIYYLAAAFSFALSVNAQKNEFVSSAKSKAPSNIKVSYKHFLIYGQSMSTGQQSYPAISTENIAGNYMIGDQIWINYGCDASNAAFNPLVGKIANIFEPKETIMSRNSATFAECPLLGTVNHIQKMIPGQKIVATSCGTSGTSIEELSKESQTTTNYSEYLKALEYAAEIAKNTDSNIYCPAIILMQGEWNYLGKGSGLLDSTKSTTNKKEYKALMCTLKDNMQADVTSNYGQPANPLLLTYQCGGYYIRGKEQTIGMAQLEASNEEADIICAGPIYPMTDRIGHLDTNGYRWYGEMLGKVFYLNSALSQDFKPLQPKTITRTEDSCKIIIQFLVPKMPLTLDSLILPKLKDYGFEIYKNDLLQVITKVSIVDDCIILTCSESLNGKIEVTYAGQATGGNGNLRDSDPYQSVYNYIDLDKKNSDSSYVYPRDSTETTLRPSYEPKDSTGQVIYDQPYPLYNFCTSFYYKLEANQQTYLVPNLNLYTPTGKRVQKTDLTVSQIGKSLILSNLNHEDKEIRISIFNTSGVLINQKNEMIDSNEKRMEHSLSNLSAGLYIAKIETKKHIKTIKFLLK